MVNRTRQEITGCVLSAIDNLNAQQAEDQRIERSPTAPLFGRGGPLDSLGLVNLIVAVEEQLADDWQLSLTLADEKAMSRRTSPFRTAETLIDFILELLADRQQAAA